MKLATPEITGTAPSTPLSADVAALDTILQTHAQLRDRFHAEAEQHESRGNRLSWLRLTTFLAVVVILGGAFLDRSGALGMLGLVALAGFFAAVAAHGRIIAAQEKAQYRRDTHIRHIARAGLGWTRFPNKGETLLPRDHAYAWDIDLVGQGSLFQRIDVTHTHLGAQTLANWLAAGSDMSTARARQVAVQELRDQLELRRELEVAAANPKGEKLDATRVQALVELPLLFQQKPWLRPISFVLPVLTLGAIALGSLGMVPSSTWVLFAIAQGLLLMRVAPELRNTLDVSAAKAPALQAYKEMLLVLEQARWQSPLLQALQERVKVEGKKPSAQLARLAFWVGLADARLNILHVVLNTLLCWDLHVVHGLEGFVRDVGRRVNAWFLALAELEALCAFASLAELDPSASMPELADERMPLTAAGLAHPLLAPDARVANDLHLRGPGSALVVTGSNMAGKSTLLRSVGLNIALALAGGPVIARSMQVPRVRLRASMRADDSLEAGSSYFHAELSKLKRVIEDAELPPPVFFLLDELLRGTNARARHVGARAVLVHLLDRSGTGLCATHDVELAALGNQDEKRIENVHFTDVMMNGEMCFDYRLRQGIVRTSNALRLLALAGIDVPMAEREALEGADARLDSTGKEPKALE
ncbi:MAG TPA: hypothetical protein VFN67_00785 [Polyangiales bacterium]|nr:hypothetical protein [Polyangiales bacterium]